MLAVCIAHVLQMRPINHVIPIEQSENLYNTGSLTHLSTVAPLAIPKSFIAEFSLRNLGARPISRVKRAQFVYLTKNVVYHGAVRALCQGGVQVAMKLFATAWGTAVCRRAVFIANLFSPALPPVRLPLPTSILAHVVRGTEKRLLYSSMPSSSCSSYNCFWILRCSCCTLPFKKHFVFSAGCSSLFFASNSAAATMAYRSFVCSSLFLLSSARTEACYRECDRQMRLKPLPSFSSPCRLFQCWSRGGRPAANH